jgi:hypothetical protein
VVPSAIQVRGTCFLEEMTFVLQYRKLSYQQLRNPSVTKLNLPFSLKIYYSNINKALVICFLEFEIFLGLKLYNILLWTCVKVEVTFKKKNLYPFQWPADTEI